MKIVQKFGGSSLADSQAFKNVKKIVEEYKPLVVVPSAPGRRDKKDHKITDLLYMCHELGSLGLNFDEIFIPIIRRYLKIAEDLKLSIDVDGELNIIRKAIERGASKEFVASRGEYLNGLLLSEFLGYEFVDAKDCIAIEDEKWNKEETLRLVEENLIPKLPCVVPGFYGVGSKGEIKTFPRSGSDVSGAVISHAISSDLYQNWTDVSGFLVADPGIVHNPKPMRIVSYKELRELSYMGANVFHEDAIHPVKEKKIPIEIKNTNDPNAQGTRIVTEDIEGDSNPITGIAGKGDFAVISIEKDGLTKDFSSFRKMVSLFETNKVQIHHMPSGIDSVSIIVSKSDISGIENKIKEELSIYLNPDEINISTGLALISCVGRGMVSRKGISSKIFTTLANNNINIRMISQGAGELNIVVGVMEEDKDNAIRAIYDAFY